MRIDVEAARPAASAREIGPEVAVLPLLGGGAVELIRNERRAVYRMPSPPTVDELVHPHLAPVATFFASWLGREAIHAGAYAAGGPVIALTAEREGGKSTTLAALADRGATIAADDVCVIAGGMALAGPRCIDLRDPGATTATGRARRRLTLPPVAPEMPYGGLVSLVWGERLELRALSGSERVALIAARRNDPLGDRPRSPLDLAAMPGWELRRPRRLDLLPAVCERLLDLAASL